MTEQQTTYATTKEINHDEQTEPREYRAYGRGVFEVSGDQYPELACECYSSKFRNVTYAQACEMAEKIAAMLNQSNAY